MNECNKCMLQERAWYDAHRDDILRGGLGERMEEEGINLFQYFSSAAYSGTRRGNRGGERVLLS